MKSIRFWDPNYRMRLMLFLLIGVLVIVINFYIVIIHPTQKFVSFDMKGSVKTFTQELSKKNLNDDQRNVLISNFMQLLQQDTAEYSKKNKVVVLVSGAVVAGDVPDITSEIETEVASQIKNIWPKGAA